MGGGLGWEQLLCHVYSPASSHTQADTHKPCMLAKEAVGEWRRRERERRQLQEAEPAQGAGIMRGAQPGSRHAFHRQHTRKY